MCAGESSLLLFFRFSLIQNDGAESDCAFCSSLVAFYSCSLVACAFFQLFGCELFLFVVSPSVFKLKSLLHFEFHWVGVWEISTLHICFIPGHMYPIRLPILYSDRIVSQENARCRCQVVSKSSCTHPSIRT